MVDFEWNFWGLISVYYLTAAEPASLVQLTRVVTTNYYFKSQPAMMPASKINFIFNFTRRVGLVTTRPQGYPQKKYV